MGKAELKLEIDEELLSQARTAAVSLDAALEIGVRQILARMNEPPSEGIVAAAARQKADPAGAEARARKWAEDNAEAIADYNRRITERGLFGTEWRKW